MKRMLPILLSLSLITCSSTVLASECHTTKCTSGMDCLDCYRYGYGCPHFVTRSQSVNAARDLVGWQKMINLADMDEKNYGALAITPEYTRSFRPCRIAGYLFGQAYKEGQLTISGSAKGNPNYVARGKFEWLADYLGLPYDFVSTVEFTPRIQNFMVDFNLYLGLDDFWEGGFFRINAPLTWTRWGLNPCETVVEEGETNFYAGYMGVDEIDRADLPKSWLEAMHGDHTFGDMQEKMKYGKIPNCHLTKTGLSDIHVALGWNFLTDKDHHIGVGLRAVFPTGNKPCATYLFEPVVGNTGHYGLGGMITSHAVLWKSEDEERDWAVYLDANITHLFSRKLMRSFDLKDKPNSRYMLIQEMTTSVNNLLAGTLDPGAVPPEEPVKPSHQYKGNLFPLINKSTCCTEVRIGVEGDLVIKFAYTTGNWSWDVGYNLWGRAGEKYNPYCCDDCCLEEGKYALKGDARLYGWVANDADTDGVGTPHPSQGQAIRMSATESEATIYSGTNTPVGKPFETDHAKNPTIDTPVKAWPDPALQDNNALLHAADNYDVNKETRTSSTPELLTCDHLSMCTCPTAMSHKVFMHFSYAAKDREEGKCIPFFGFGAEVELGQLMDGVYGAVSQWGVWLKGGMSFN